MTSKAKIVTTVWPFTVKNCQSLALYQLCPNSYKPDGEDQQTVFTIYTPDIQTAKFRLMKINPKPKKPEEPLHRITMTFCPFPKGKGNKNSTGNSF